METSEGDMTLSLDDKLFSVEISIMPDLDATIAKINARIASRKKTPQNAVKRKVKVHQGE